MEQIVLNIINLIKNSKVSVTDAIAAFGALLTGTGLIYTGIQVRLARKTARNQFLIQLYQLMDQHNEIHARLTGMGWPEGRTGPETVEEWLKVGRALGLFEYVNILVENKFIDINTVDKLYSYRLFHLMNNEVIYKRHFSQEGKWEGIFKLHGKLKNKKMYKLLSVQASPPLDLPKIARSIKKVKESSTVENLSQPKVTSNIERKQHAKHKKPVGSR